MEDLVYHRIYYKIKDYPPNDYITETINEENLVKSFDILSKDERYYDVRVVVETISRKVITPPLLH